MPIKDHTRFWVIYRKPDGAIMPMPEKTSSGIIVGFSHVEFNDSGLKIPRLFRTEASARQALIAWCAGNWTVDEGSTPYVVHDPHLKRDRSDYGVALAEIRLL